MLATTFTNRAATELRERVRSFLVEQGDYDGAVAIGAARIGTVNSVCGGLLQRFAFEAGLLTEQRVLDEARASQLLRETIDTVIAGHSLTELLQVARRLSLDSAPQGCRRGRRPSASWSTRPVRTSDRCRCPARCWWLERGEPAGTLPGTRYGRSGCPSAASHRSSAAGGQDGARANATEERGEYLEQLHAAERSLQDGTLTWALWNKLTAAAPAKLRTVAEPVIEAAGLYTAHPRLRDDLTRYLELMYALAADALDAYATAKRQIGALDFTDQERLLLDVLDDPSVASTLGDELDLLMVDEFQDTSPIQLALFLKLAQYARQVVWVGDIKQAIYGFRGSDTVLMRSVIEALPKLGGTKEVLEYSGARVLRWSSSVNHVFANRFEGIPPSEVELSPKRPEIDNAVAVADWLLDGSNAEKRNAALAAGICKLLASDNQVVDTQTGCAAQGARRRHCRSRSGQRHRDSHRGSSAGCRNRQRGHSAARLAGPTRGGARARVHSTPERRQRHPGHSRNRVACRLC